MCVKIGLKVVKENQVVLFFIPHSSFCAIVDYRCYALLPFDGRCTRKKIILRIGTPMNAAHITVDIKLICLCSDSTERSRDLIVASEFSKLDSNSSYTRPGIIRLGSLVLPTFSLICVP